MKNNIEYKGFIGVVHFNAEEEDMPYLGGYILGTNDIGFHGQTVDELVKEFHHAVDTCLLDPDGKPIAPSEPPESHWNYRVIEKRNEYGEVFRAIHEVHYERDMPVSYTKDPVRVEWEVEFQKMRFAPEDGGQWVLEQLHRATLQPVLKPEDFRSPRRDLRRVRFKVHRLKAVRRKRLRRQKVNRYLRSIR